MAINNMPESPVKARIPSTANIHKITKTPAISLNGPGSEPTMANKTSKIITFIKVTGWLFIVNSVISGNCGNPEM
jgi:hypothetical protein